MAEPSAPRAGRRSRRRLDIQRLIGLAPVQERFGPSLPELIAPRIDRLPAIARRVAAVIGAIVVAVVIALVLRTRDAVFSCPPSTGLTCSIPYPHSLTREPAPPGALLLLRQSDASGLVASFQVGLLHLPPYSGEISGLLPVVAINYERRLAAITPAFQLQSLGRTRIINTPAFTFTYSFYPKGGGGIPYFGRIVFITPHLTGDRTGLLLSMVQLPSTLKAATAPADPTPDAVGAGGSLQDPLQHLRIG
jgi:hypothetical protein